MVYLKLIPTNFKTVSPDKRELSVARKMGFSVRVVAITDKGKDYEAVYDGWDVCYISTYPTDRMQWLQRRLHWNGLKILFRFMGEVLQTDADIVSAHDYLPLIAAYMANLCKRKKAKLIYDSREFELYRNAPGRTDFQRRVIKLVEGFLIRRVDLALMVGDKIADEVQEIYRLKTRPTVVRNIPPYWHLEPEKSVNIRREFLRAMALPDTGFLLMYHGGIMAGRGIGQAIRALALLSEDVGMVIMGEEPNPGMVEQLRKLAGEMGVGKRVLFKKAVPIHDLKNYVGAVDAEMVLIEGKTCRSYAYSLPNKFFESIQACVPMVCSDLPEMGKLVRQYDIGILVNENDEREIAEAVLRLREDKALYNRLKGNMEKAKEELCWEKESRKLETAIRQMMGQNHA